MMGMQERARICQGEIVITGEPGGGTKLQLTIPLDKGEQQL
jgi:two-component system, NarL family, sensor histidine kinase UhpB